MEGVLFRSFTTAFIGLLYYFVPRLCGAPLYKVEWGWWLLWIWNAFLMLGSLPLCMGYMVGAVAKSLLERGHEVRAVTRNPDSLKAKKLGNAGATLITASLEETAALTRALEGATSLFAVTPLIGDTDAETRQGISAAEAAKATGVRLVFNSVASANRQTGIPHFESKYAVERHIAKIGVRATILAPVYVMENLYFVTEQLTKGIYVGPLPPTRKLAQVAVADIGAVAVRLLENESRFTGSRFDLASDERATHSTLRLGAARESEAGH